MTALHWTWEYIDDCMTLPRLTAIWAHWDVSPPVHVSVAAFLGIGKRGSAPSNTLGTPRRVAAPDAVVDDSDEVGLALMKMFGEAGGIITGV